MKHLSETILESQTNESLRDTYNNVAEYIKQSDFLNKIGNISKNILKKSGKTLLINILKLYYILIDKNTDIKDKLSIMSALIYLINPVDVVPDIAVLGYTDDLALIEFLIIQFKRYDTPVIKKLAENKFNEWFSKKDIKKIQ